MKLKFVCSIAAAVVFSVAAFAQAGGSSSAALPAAPGAADPAPTAPAFSPTATKIAAINVEQAIFATNEGQRDMSALQKKFEPKFNDLKTKNDELEALNKQLGEAGGNAHDRPAEGNASRVIGRQCVTRPTGGRTDVVLRGLVVATAPGDHRAADEEDDDDAAPPPRFSDEARPHA